MKRYHNEYRINKKGAECYRTREWAEAKAKFDELSAKRPGVYTMQSRSCQLDRYGCEEMDCSGRALWTPWG